MTPTDYGPDNASRPWDATDDAGFEHLDRDDDDDDDALTIVNAAIFALEADAPLPTTTAGMTPLPVQNVRPHMAPATDHPNRELYTPDRVDWSAVTPVLPRAWRPVRRPLPVPGGALVVVSQPVPSLRRTLHVVLFWSASTGSIYNYFPHDAHVQDARRAVFGKTGDAFTAAEGWAAWHRLPLDPKPWKTSDNRRAATADDAAAHAGLDPKWAPRPQYVQEHSAYAPE